MDSRRLQYLRAMDIDVWVRRDAPASLAPLPTDAVVTTHVMSTDTAADQQLVHPLVHQPAASATAANHESADFSQATWSELEQAVSACTLCALHSTRTQTVFGVGNRVAEWMVIGEAPGAEEDRQGEPFVGRAGQLLNSMLKATGFPREQVFIANILKCRPPNNRDPRPEEAACCTPYLARQIALVKPRIIVCVGRIAAQNLLAVDTPIGKLRGKVHRWGAQQLPVVVTYHPAYLLRSPGEKRKAWKDLQLALQVYAESPTRKQAS